MDFNFFFTVDLQKVSLKDSMKDIFVLELVFSQQIDIWAMVHIFAISSISGQFDPKVFYFSRKNRLLKWFFSSAIGISLMPAYTWNS